MDVSQSGSFSSKRMDNKSSNSQLRIFAILLVGIFSAEVLAMIVIYFISPKQYWIETLLDASIMTILIFPILYHFHFRPLFTQISERNRSEALLNKVLENLPVGVWLIDQNGAILRGNKASLSIWSGAKYVGIEQYGEYKAWRLDSGKLVEPDEWAGTRAIRTGETILEEELEIECFDGSRKIILNSATPIFENNTVQGAIVVNQDITARKQAEQALAKNEALFETAFQILPVGAWITDETGKIIIGNPAGQEIWAGARYVGIEQFGDYKGWWLNTGKQISADEWAISRAIKKGETSLNEEIEIECFDGTHKFILNSAIPVRDEQGQMHGVFVVNQDITERKRAEMLLERQNQNLKRLSLIENKQRQFAESLVQSMLAVNANLRLQDVLNTILEQIQRSIPYELANISLIENDSLRVARFLDLTNGPEKQDFAENLYQPENYPFIKEIFAMQPVLLEDSSLVEQQQIIPGMQKMRSYLAVPLVVANRVTGIISLASNQPGKFDQETASRLTAFAAPAAFAVENARLFAAELKARQLAETLNAVSLALTQTLNFDQVLNTLMEYVCRLVPSDLAYIVISEDETTVTLQIISGFEGEIEPIHTLGESYDVLERSYLHEVLITQKSLLISDTQKYPGWKALITNQPGCNWLGIPIVVGGKSIGVLALEKTCPSFFTSEHVRISEMILAQASVAIQNAWLFEQVRAGHERLQSLSRHLVEVQESERRFIARELHDEASQALTALMFGLQLLEQEANRPEIFLPRLSELKQLTDKVLEGLHRLAMGLRPASLDYLGLVSALEQLVKDNNERYHMNTRYKVTGFTEDQRLPGHVETNVYRIVQEALTNAVRHANAKNTDVILEQQDGKVIVIVEDDGIGFDAVRGAKSGRLGLLGMQERAQMISGTLQIESVPGCGTTIVLEIPNVDSNINR